MITTVYESTTMYLLMAGGYALVRITRDGKAILKKEED